MLREPRWIALLIAVPIGIVICLILSDWQWNRYEGRKSSNEVQSANMALPIEDAAQAMPPGTEVTDANQWRMITATGTYVPAGQVLVRKKPLNNTNGFWVATPLVTASGDVVVVNRGWVRADSDAKSTPVVPPPPTGTVTVEGRIEASAANQGPRPADLPAGQVSSLDVATIGAVAGASILPGYLELTKSTPPQAPGLTTIPAPEISEGPHLSYSMQWIAFAIMFGIGVVLLARRELQVRRREAELAEGQGPPDDPDDDPVSDTRPGESSQLPQDSHR
ncbi:MAG: SURF1 family protein [Candidatus Nanopelagicales bacterium]